MDKAELFVVEKLLAQIRSSIQAGQKVSASALEIPMDVGISCEIKSEYPNYKGYTLQIGIDKDMNISKLELVKD